MKYIIEDDIKTFLMAQNGVKTISIGGKSEFIFPPRLINEIIQDSNDFKAWYKKFYNYKRYPRKNLMSKTKYEKLKIFCGYIEVPFSMVEWCLEVEWL